MKNLTKAANFAKALFTRELCLDFEYIPFRITELSSAKLAALFATEMDRMFPKPELRSRPSVLQVEPTNVCNLKCTLCPSGRRELDRPSGFMAPGMFEKLMDEVGSSVSFIILWEWGEPLLHPEIDELIKSAKRRNIAVITSTNGQIMDAGLAGRLVESGLDWIVFALDGASQETYGSYRMGGSQSKVVDSLMLLQEAKRRRNSITPRINLRMVATSANEYEVPLVRDVAQKQSTDMFTIRAVGMTDLWDDREDGDYVPQDGSLNMYRFNGGERVKASEYKCRRPWKRVTVAYDGSIVPCEFDYTNSSAYGVYPDDGSFYDIINGSRARAFREAFLEDRMQFEFCVRCPYNDMVSEDCTVEYQEVSR